MEFMRGPIGWVIKIQVQAYSKLENGIGENLYGANKLNTTLADGSDLELTQITKYPWDGAVEIKMDKCKDEVFDVMLRIPGWAKGATVQVNGKSTGIDVKSGEYAIINRKWKKGDNITINMPMPVTFVEGNTQIEEVRNQVAVKRGPVVYCVETPDLPENSKITDVYLKSNAPMKAKFKKDLLDGVTAFETTLQLRTNNNNETMYNPVTKPTFKN